MSKRPARSTAEWVTFAVSALVVLVLLAAIAVEAARTDDPAAPVAAIGGAIEVHGRQFHVPVSVTNRGDETAEAVRVLASLEIGGEVVEGDQTVDFLAGGDRQEVIFVFDEDPAGGVLSIRVTGFTVP